MSANEWVTLLGLGVGVAIAGIALSVAAVGLFQARSLLRRELAAYFLSPIAYVVLVVFLAVTGYLFSLTVDQLTTTGPEGVEYPLRFMFGDERFWLVFLMIPPLITMRSFAEERSSGTLEMLMTSPLRDGQIVMAKFLGCFFFYVLLWLPTLLYVPLLFDVTVSNPQLVVTPWSLLCVVGVLATLAGFVLLIPRVSTGLRLASLLLFGLGLVAAVGGGVLHQRHDATHLVEVSWGIDPAPVVTFYTAILLAGAMFLALGLFVSSRVRDQLVAAILSLLASLLFVVAGFWKPDLDADTTFDRLVYFFSVPLHFNTAFTRGLFDTRPLVLYGSVAVFFLFLTVRSLESRRWQ